MQIDTITYETALTSSVFISQSSTEDEMEKQDRKPYCCHVHDHKYFTQQDDKDSAQSSKFC